MKERHLYIVLAFLVLVGLLIYLWPKISLVSEPGPQVASRTPPPSKPDKVVAAKDVHPAPTSTVSAPKDVKSMTSADKSFLELFKAVINVHGKVVDERGEPVSGATVLLSVADRPWESGSKHTKTTDSKGLFSFLATGASVAVYVSKDGYYSRDKSSGMINSGPFRSESDPPLPTRSSPSVFVLYKKGEAAALVHLESGVDLPKDGTPAFIDLVRGRVSGTGDIKVECWVHDQGVDTTVYNPYDWRCIISVPGGGLLERGDKWEFTAPVDGYRQSDKLQMPKTTYPWRPQLLKEYFVKRADGAFARVQIRVGTGSNNRVLFESYLNPIPGDRNLEFDPAKTAPKP